MMTRETIKILCVDDHPLVLEGIARKLDREADMRVVGTAGSAKDGIGLYKASRPNIVLMDLQLPGMSGLQAIQTIIGYDPHAKIIVLTMYQGEEDIHRALQAGARSYILKDALVNDLIRIVREVHAGGRPIPPSIASRLARRAEQTALSPREIEVVELIAKGHRNKEIADTLGVTQDTVQTHIKRLFLKLGVNDRTAAVTVAISKGIVHIDA